jgi:hypothetical protein
MDCPIVNVGNCCDEPSGSATAVLNDILGRLKARHSLGWTTHVQMQPIWNNSLHRGIKYAVKLCVKRL